MKMFIPVSAIPHLRIYLKEIIKVVCKDLTSRAFDTELFIIAKYLQIGDLIINDHIL